MDALLISPDYGSRKDSFPWGALALGSYLTNVKKRDIYLLDANALSRHKVKEELHRFLKKTKLVGISCLTTDVHYVKKLIDYIKENYPDTPIIVGGPHAILEPEQTCRYKNIDFVAYGNGEQTMDTLIGELSKETPNYENVPGLIYKNEGCELKRTPPVEFAGFYDINYELLPESTKSTLPQYIQVLTGRGCSYKCRFCYNSVISQTFHPRPAEEIIAELEKIVKKYNPELIYFRDDNFFQVKQRVVDFIRLYKKKKFNFPWRATCRANFFSDKYINSDFIKELESVNCSLLKMGIESGTQRVLNYLKKGINLKSIKRAVTEVSKSNIIKGNYSFMLGLPTQTFEEYVDTIKLIKFILSKEPGADIIGPQYFRVYPGGSLYEEITEKFDFKKPESFEEWAKRTNRSNDPLGMYRDIQYPWVPSNADKYLALHGNLLVLLYRKPLKDLFTLQKFPAIPFALLAKLRVKKNWYRNLYDIRLLVKLNDILRRVSGSTKTLRA